MNEYEKKRLEALRLAVEYCTNTFTDLPSIVRLENTANQFLNYIEKGKFQDDQG